MTGSSAMTIVIANINGSRTLIAVDTKPRKTALLCDYDYAEGKLPPRYPVPSTLGPVVIADDVVWIDPAQNYREIDLGLGEDNPISWDTHPVVIWS